jgi:CelD/BcsL family acetyltransferase involved in cellulose biosynthesis
MRTSSLRFHPDLQRHLNVEEVKHAEELPRYRDEWQDLLSRADRPLLFQTYEWMTSWLESFWKDRALAFLFLRDGQRLDGLAPLLEDEQGEFSCSGSVVLPADGDFAIRGDILCAGDRAAVLDSVVRHLRATRRGVRLTLKHLQTDSALLTELSSVAARNRLGTFQRRAWTSPMVRFEGGWETYLGSRSGHLRSELRRKNRRIEAAGTVACVTACTPAEAERALDDVLAIERRSWKQPLGSSLAFRPTEERFLRKLARRCAESGWLRLYFLHLDSRPVAYLYGFVFGNEYYAFATSFDESYRELSPGTVLFERVLRDSCERGLQVFDFLGGETRWKSEIATEQRHHADVCVFSRDQLRCRLCKTYQTRVKPFVKARMPFVLSIKRRLGRRFRGQS